MRTTTYVIEDRERGPTWGTDDPATAEAESKAGNRVTAKVSHNV